MALNQNTNMPDTGKSPIINGNTVTFIYRGNAETVYVAGEYNQWELEDRMSKNEEGVWYINKRFPENARFDYKLIVDGNWITDPLNEKTTCVSADNINSNLIMPKYSSDHEKIVNSQVPKGNLLKNVKLKSDYMGCSMNYHVYLPHGYENSHISHVLYVMDGSEYLNYANIDRVLDYMIHMGEIPRMVAVLTDPNDRNAEYTISRKHYSYFIKELVPFAERNYLSPRVMVERSIIGVSWGGLTALYIAANTPGKFNRLLSQSGSFWPKDWLIFDIISKADVSNMKFCLQTGTVQDTEEMNDALAKLIESKHGHVEYAKYSESHNWMNWKGHLNEGLKTLYSGIN